MQVPLARIIELINNVAQRGMAVIKEPRLCVKILWGVWCVGVWGRAVSGAHAAVQPFDLQPEEAKLILQMCIKVDRKVHVQAVETYVHTKDNSSGFLGGDVIRTEGVLSRTSSQLNSAARL